MDAIEAMETCRAIRYLRPDPVPEALLRRVVHAATCASNPGNSQGWGFVVVRDPGRRARIRDAIAPMGAAIDALERTDAAQARMLAGAAHLARHLGRVPVLIFVCGRAVYPPEAPSLQMLWASLYPAAQNLVVAARALGLGTTFTTFHLAAEDAVREVLALPDDVRIGVTVALGWPDRPFGPVRRRPLDEVLYWERWGAAAREAPD